MYKRQYAGLLGSGIALPLGLSFYSFQMAAYVIDVYRGRMEPEECPVSYAAEILMFPKLLSGPLMDPADLKEQMYRRTCTLRKLDAGLRDFIIGLSMKVLLANQIGGLWRQVKTIGFESVSTPMAWLGLVAYSLQLYLDFCGYSWMAIGVGETLGFRLPRNFEHPYAARSMRDFWRRWHISLSSWFRDYVYIPLGGNRVSKAKWFRNIFIVWLLTGLWHGAAWTFILWGLFFAVFLTAEKLWYGEALAQTRFLKHLYVLLLIAVSFVIFDAASVSDAFRTIGSLFGLGGLPRSDVLARYYFDSYSGVFLVAIVGATPLPAKIVRQFSEDGPGKKIMSVMEPVVLLGLLAVVTAYLVDGSFNPFLYFRF